MSRRILLVGPLESSWAHTTSPEFKAMLGLSAMMPPLGLATVAALTPSGVDVRIHDENVHGPVAESRLDVIPDLVGITGFDIHRPQVVEIATYFRSKGIPVAIGGPGISAAPEEYERHADHLFLGEAEHTWPEFIDDWQNGRAKRVYRQIQKPDLGSSPLPRWDLLADDFSKYAAGTVQTTRGCPFDCEFCDVIYLYGRKPRHKPVAQVIEELRQLERLGCYNVFVCDDNFVGDPAYAKEMLRAIIRANDSFARPVSFRTQLTIDVARNDELLALLADANFAEVFVGVESPNPESLRGMNKPQNLRSDLASDLRKIMSFGIPVTAGMIVGCDEDDATIFQRQFDFIQRDAALFQVALSILNAPKGTKLFHRLRREGRVIRNEAPGSTSGVTTNIIPKRMTRIEAMEGLAWLLTELNKPEHAFERIREVIRTVRRRPRRRGAMGLAAVRSELPRVKRLWGYLLFRTPRAVRAEFFKTIAYCAWKAPWFMEKALLMSTVSVLFQSSSRTTVEHLRRQIEGEKQRGTGPVLASKTSISPAFRASLRTVFPPIHAKVVLGLLDGSRTNEALVEIFVDFIDRFGEVASWEKEHENFLDELCGRTIARINGTSSAPANVAPPGPRDVHLALWREDIIKAVEQTLEAPFLRGAETLVELRVRSRNPAPASVVDAETADRPARSES